MSVRLGVRSAAWRWERAAGGQKHDDRGPGRELAGMAKDHSSEAFFGCDNPLEAMVFSALLEIQRKQDRGKDHVDP